MQSIFRRNEAYETTFAAACLYCIAKIRGAPGRGSNDSIGGWLRCAANAEQLSPAPRATAGATPNAAHPSTAKTHTTARERDRPAPILDPKARRSPPQCAPHGRKELET